MSSCSFTVRIITTQKKRGRMELKVSPRLFSPSNEKDLQEVVTSGLQKNLLGLSKRARGGRGTRVDELYEETERLKIRFAAAYDKLHKQGRISDEDLDDILDAIDRIDELSAEELERRLGRFKRLA